MGSYLIGFDMGGTKMLATVLDEDLTHVGKARRKTPSGAGNKETFAAIAETVHEAAADAQVDLADVSVIGIAVPGPIDRNAGRIIETPNAGLRDFPLQDRLRKETGVPVVLENDVNAGVYGEFVAGAARGFKNIVGIFPGTGVGGGIIIDGKLYRGRLGRAGEIGHMIVEVGGRLCGCGKYGCLEAVSSKTAINKDRVHLAAIGDAPTIHKTCGTDFKRINSKAIKKAMAAGESAVIRVVERAAWYLGIGLANCVDIFDPDVLVIGGGLIEKLGDDYLSLVEKSMRDNVMVPTDVPVVAAELGDDAVVIGAAALGAATVGEAVNS